jgi:HEPN domain-containing protein
MTPDEALAAETRAWLGKAREDLLSARALIGAGLPAPALFHCQQAARV